MKSILIAESVYERIALLGRAWDTSESEVVRRLLDEFTRSGSPAKDSERRDQIAIHCVYDGHRIEAIYHPTTKGVDVTTGALTGQTFKSPSGAAVAVVHAYKPGVHPNRNGWDFWMITENGQLLKSIRKG